MKEMSFDEWVAEGKKRFGNDQMAWRFVCPSCGHVASMQDWKDAGASSNAVGFSCIGRYTGSPTKAAENAFKKKGGPCNYTLGGLIVLEHISIFDRGKSAKVFEFADAGVAP